MSGGIDRCLGPWKECLVEPFQAPPIPKISGIEKNDQRHSDQSGPENLPNRETGAGSIEFRGRRQESVQHRDEQPRRRKRSQVNNVGLFGENHSRQSQNESPKILRFSGAPNSENAPESDN